jgi:hypothetical protein
VRKNELNALERIFAAEVDGRLPLQSTARIYHHLKDLGLVLYGTEKKGADRFGLIEVSGWYLSQAGRRAYCDLQS